MPRTRTAAAAGLALVAATFAVPSATGPAAAQACAPGALYFSQDDDPNGLYSVDLTTGEATIVGEGITGVDSGTVGLTESDDPTVLWGSTWTDFAIINSDGSGSEVLDTDVEAEGLGYDAGSGRLYGAINGEFFLIDPTTGTRELDELAQPEADIEGLAADAATGVVYGLSGDGVGPLHAYDPVADDWGTVDLDVDVDWEEPGLALDPSTGVLWAVNGDEDVFTIDPGTGAVDLVGQLGLEELEGGGAGFVAGDCPPPTTTTTTAPTTSTTSPTTTAAARPATVVPRFTG